MDKSIRNRLIKDIEDISAINSVTWKRLLKNSYKIIIDRFLSFSRISFKLVVKTIWGGRMQVILPERVSNAIWRNSFFDENVTIYLLKFLEESNTFVDIGSHFGFYTLFGSYLTGNDGLVISFEPTPSTFQQLTSNVKNFASDNNIKLYNNAAYNNNTEIEFHDFGLINSAFNTMKNSRSDKRVEFKKIIINAVNLDSFFESNYSGLKIDIIKIDAESSEYEILLGLDKTIRKYFPKIILEVGDLTGDDKNNSLKLIEHLLGLGYYPYEYLKGKVIKHNIIREYGYNNLIFIKEGSVE